MNKIRARTVLAAVCALGLISCGGGSSSPYVDLFATYQPAPTPLAGPFAPRPDINALRIYQSAAMHAWVTGLALNDRTYFVGSARRVAASDPCTEISIDGQPVLQDAALPSGGHTLVANFSNWCDNLYSDVDANGTSTVEYTTVGEGQIATATYSTNSLRSKGIALNRWSAFYDVTADGSGFYGLTQTSTEYLSTYAPAAGSSLTNNATTNVATFGGGSYSTGQVQSAPSGETTDTEEFNSLVVAINGTSYVLDGNLSRVGLNGTLTSATGEVRITSNGVLVARIYFWEAKTLSTEVLSPLVPF